jgi:hypothetical protein
MPRAAVGLRFEKSGIAQRLLDLGGWMLAGVDNLRWCAHRDALSSRMLLYRLFGMGREAGEPDLASQVFAPPSHTDTKAEVPWRGSGRIIGGITAAISLST